MIYWVVTVVVFLVLMVLLGSGRIDHLVEEVHFDGDIVLSVLVVALVSLLWGVLLPSALAYWVGTKLRPKKVTPKYKAFVSDMYEGK